MYVCPNSKTFSPVHPIYLFTQYVLRSWLGPPLIMYDPELDPDLDSIIYLKLKFRKYPAIHTNYIISHSTTFTILS